MEIACNVQNSSLSIVVRTQKMRWQRIPNANIAARLVGQDHFVAF